MDIQDAKVVITGGTSGIGKEIAKKLQEKGAQVVVCGRDKQKLEQTTQELNVFGFPADVSNEADVKELFEFAVQKMESVNVLINNAGIGHQASLTETTPEDFTRLWETNVKGAFLAAREAAKIFKENNTGNLINICSSSGKRGYAGGSAYVAGKFALSGLTECWRAELRPHNVRVMQINPSEVITDFFPRLGIEQSQAQSKLKPSEIAHVVLCMLEMNDVGFITEAAVWATNPK